MGLDQCIEHIRFARAAELARIGRYLEAEGILSPKGLMPETSRELDLLARIATLQKQFSRAEMFWQAALQKSPENEDYIECLKVIRNLDPATDFNQNEEDTDVLETGLVVVVWVVALFSIATLIYVFYPRK